MTTDLNGIVQVTVTKVRCAGFFNELSHGVDIVMSKINYREAALRVIAQRARRPGQQTTGAEPQQKRLRTNRRRTRTIQETGGVIGRCKNRRLYCKAVCGYVTHPDVAARVRDGVPVKVLDRADNNSDITKTILIAILTEHATAIFGAISSDEQLYTIVQQVEQAQPGDRAAALFQAMLAVKQPRTLVQPAEGPPTASHNTAIAA